MNNLSLGSLYLKRIIIKRYYLSKSLVSIENLTVLANILSSYYHSHLNPSKGSIKSQIKFDAYLYADGYILEVFYNQIDHKKVDSILHNSYLKTDIFLNNIVEKKISAPYIIVTAKKRILDNYNKYTISSLNQLLSESGIKYSYPVLDLNLVSSTSYDEIDKVINLIKNKADIQEIYIDNNHNFLSYNKEKKHVFAFNYNLDAKDIYGTYDDISLGYIFEFDEIDSLKTYSILNIIFDNLKENITSFLLNNYKIKCNCFRYDISRIRNMIIINFKSTPILNIKERIDSLIEAFFSSELNISSSALLLEKVKGTKLLTSYLDGVNRLKLVQDYSLEVDYDSFFYKYEININEIREFFSSIRFIKNINCYDDRSLK